ncbi:hypothetical protein [uncultured Nostoc sp.]|uniref:hypothetical protein n=1 Tax=uncultured Nostoc sp. TaxID=340711 RepID=UPI0035CB5536
MRPLKLGSLRYLAQRWDSPQALTLGMPYPSCIAEAVRWAAMPLLLQLLCKSCLV